MISFFCAIALFFGVAVSIPFYVTAIPAVLCGGHCVYKIIRKRDLAEIRIEAVTLSVFIVYILLSSESALFYRVLSNVSGIAGMSVTYSGIDLAALFFIAHAAALIVYKVRTPILYVRNLAPVIAIWAVYMGLWPFLTGNLRALRLNLVEPLTGPLDFRFLLLVALLLFWSWSYGKLRQRKSADVNTSVKKHLIVAAAACSAMLLFSVIGPAAPAEKPGGLVVFWDSGLDFEIPEIGRYGLTEVGMFGALPLYLSNQGYECRIVNRPGGEALKEADVLVVINPMYTPGRDDLESIWKFVENGGGLLAVGDHTGIEQIRAPMNAILEPVNIEINFDSAIPFRTMWPDDFVMRRTPVFSNITYQQVQVVVGASLSVGSGAKPILMGQNGFSDAGDETNLTEGYLGNMRLDRGESVGDMILAAEAKYGKGRIVAFGDTTSFQNTILAYSYPLINNIFAYLTENSTGDRKEPSSVRLPVCLIDASHVSLFSRDRSGDSVDGFTACSLRAGLLPEFFFSGNLSSAVLERDELKIIVINPHAKPYSASEKRLLRGFAERGGTLMLFGNYQSPKETLELFDFFGFSFDAVPFGRVEPLNNPEMSFWNACPVFYEGKSVGDTENAESLMDVWGESVIARIGIGKGQVYAFGDSGFIQNKNLEGIDTFSEGNISFIIELLGKAAW